MKKIIFVTFLFASVSVFAEGTKVEGPQTLEESLETDPAVQDLVEEKVPELAEETAEEQPKEGKVESPKEIARAVVDDLKQEVLNSKTQMKILKYLIRNEGVSKTYPKIDIAFNNEMGTRYKLHSLTYTIDGENAFTFFRDDSSELDEKKKLKIKNHISSLAPGTHTLNIKVVFQGNDTGVFSYISDYKTKTEGQVSFTLVKGTTTKIEVNAFEKGWILTEFKDRPDLRVKINGSAAQNFIKY